jgi:hypothetical protein
MGFRPFDRLPVVEWAEWWDQTIGRWRGEGLPADLTDRYDICRHFGLEVYLQDWFCPRGPECPGAARHGAGLLGADPSRYEEEYEQLLPHLYPWPIIDRGRWASWAEEQRRGDAVLWFTVEGFFWFPRTLFGIEQHLYAFYDAPDVMHRMNADLAEHSVRVIDELCSVCAPDFMTFAEDMSYNHGPMLSKALFDEFMAPYYAKVVPHLEKHGVLPVVDSDGDVTEAAPWFEEAGIGGIVPLERQAGVDVAKLREAHPEMRFIGCFDKMTMSRGEAAMRAEFERLLPVASKGGLIVGCDHQTPPGVSYDDYELYLRLFREYAEEAGRVSG